MRKKFKKRLLGIILTILMVVSVIPVQQVQPVKAAAGDMIPAGTTIYLRPNAATTWISDGEQLWHLRLVRTISNRELLL